MKLTDFEFAPVYTLPASLALYRIQRFANRAGDKRVGRIRLAPPGILTCRFDLPDDVVGYFADRPETAGYEALARREVERMTVAHLAQRELVCVTVQREVQLLDLRPHAQSWPVLQSLRFKMTQELAVSAKQAGYQGVIYKSAQQFGMDCMAIFGPALGRLRYAWAERLVEASLGQIGDRIGYRPRSPGCCQPRRASSACGRGCATERL
jgi:hypothetical protein